MVLEMQSLIRSAMDLSVGTPLEIISVFLYIFDGFWHTRKFRFPVVRKEKEQEEKAVNQL